MALDFTINIYRHLINTFLNFGYKFLFFEKYLNDQNKFKKIIILRHDVDKKPGDSLIKAKLESELNVSSTYYFRCVPQSYNEQIISQIAELGHEIGYHYEDLSLANGDYELAIKKFERNLTKLRKFYPVKTICMHGSPLSKWDNKKLWEKYNYRDFGIMVEPYFDIDFNNVFYITDTGRKWNYSSASVRDKVNTQFDISILSTLDLINKIKNHELPTQIMMNTHPQRWNDSFSRWSFELVSQSLKNIVKKKIIYKRNKFDVNPS